MQPLNHCRQAAQQFSETLRITRLDEATRFILSSVIHRLSVSQKFLLPDGGRLFDDVEFRCLDDDEPLRLPFPSVCLEYRSLDEPKPVDDEEVGPCPKRATLIEEAGDHILVTPIFWSLRERAWGIMPSVAIPQQNYLRRSIKDKDGRPMIVVKQENERVPLSDYADEVGAVLCFLGALQCENVRSDHRVTSARSQRSAHAFDSYRVLTLDVPRAAQATGGASAEHAHRSPREHLRRGHIRRISQGRKIAISPTIVNAGVGGVVSKDYALKPRPDLTHQP